MLSTRRFLLPSASSPFSSLLSTRSSGGLASLLRPPSTSPRAAARGFSSTPRLLSLVAAAPSQPAPPFLRRHSTAAAAPTKRPTKQWPTKRTLALNKSLTDLKTNQKTNALLTFIAEEGEAFNGVNITTAWTSLAAMPHQDRPRMRADPRFSAFLSSTALRIESDPDLDDDRTLSNVLAAVAKLGGEKDWAAGIVAGVRAKSGTIAFYGMPQNVANAAWAFATLGEEAPSLFGAIEERGEWLVQNGKPMEVAMTSWAFATLGVEAPRLFAAIEKNGQAIVKNGKNPQEVSNIAWAFATLGVEAPLLFGAIEQRGEWMVTDGKHPQAVAKTAWAFAELGVAAPSFFGALAERGEWLVKYGKPQEVARTSWAFAKLGVDAPNFLEVIRAESRRRPSLIEELEDEEARALLLTWLLGDRATTPKTTEHLAELQPPRRHSTAAAPIKPPPKKYPTHQTIALNKALTDLKTNQKTNALLAFIAEESEAFNGVNIRTAWTTLVAMPPRHRPRMKTDPRFSAFLSATARRIESDPDLDDDRTLANIIHAVAKLGGKKDWVAGVVDGVRAKSGTIAASEMPYTVANAAWAFAKLGVEAPSLFGAIDERGEWLVQNGTPLEVTMTSWAFAKLDLDAPKLRKAIQESDHSFESGEMKLNKDARALLLGWLRSGATADPIKSPPKKYPTHQTLALNKSLTDLKTNQQVDALLAFIAAESEAFDGVNIRTAWTTLVAMPPRDRTRMKTDPRFSAFLSATARRIESDPDLDDARTLANIIHAVAKLGGKNDWAVGIVDGVRAKGGTIAASEMPHTLANAAWAFAKLGVEAPSLFGAIDERGEWLVQNGKPLEVTITSWAFAKLDLDAPKLRKAIQESDHSFESGGVKLNKYARALLLGWLRSGAAAAQSKPPPKTDPTHQTLAHNKALTDLKANEQASPLLAFIASESSAFNGVNLRTAWTTLVAMPPRNRPRMRADPRFSAFLSATALRIESDRELDDARTLANVIHSVAKLGVAKDWAVGVVDGVRAKSGTIAASGEPQHVADAAWAFATLGEEAPSLFGAIDERGEWLVKSGTAEEVATIEWAFTKLGVDAPMLRKAIQESSPFLRKAIQESSPSAEEEEEEEEEVEVEVEEEEVEGKEEAAASPEEPSYAELQPPRARGKSRWGGW